jgi:hypothetical protein
VRVEHAAEHQFAPGIEQFNHHFVRYVFLKPKMD